MPLATENDSSSPAGLPRMNTSDPSGARPSSGRRHGEGPVTPTLSRATSWGSSTRTTVACRPAPWWLTSCTVSLVPTTWAAVSAKPSGEMSTALPKPSAVFTSKVASRAVSVCCGIAGAANGQVWTVRGWGQAEGAGSGSASSSRVARTAGSAAGSETSAAGSAAGPETSGWGPGGGGGVGGCVVVEGGEDGGLGRGLGDLGGGVGSGPGDLGGGSGGVRDGFGGVRDGLGGIGGLGRLDGRLGPVGGGGRVDGRGRLDDAARVDHGRLPLDRDQQTGTEQAPQEHLGHRCRAHDR